MRYTRIIAALSSLIMTAGFGGSIYAEEQPTTEAHEAAETTEDLTVRHKVTFLDLDGNEFCVLEVADDEPIDYESIDVSSMTVNEGKYTQKGFNCWDKQPEFAEEDITIRALYKKAKISRESVPVRTEFYSKKGEVVKDGLEVKITLELQTPELDENGDFIVNNEEHNITSICYAVPNRLEDAFAENENADIKIIPKNSTLPIYEYTISYYGDMGDYNADKAPDAVDASLVLSYYSLKSTGKPPELDSYKLKVSDVNCDGAIDSVDASYILTYYSLDSTGRTPYWEAIAFNNT